jgi:DNA-directed RNA polymerase specialized sigma24 family protein
MGNTTKDAHHVTMDVTMSVPVETKAAPAPPVRPSTQVTREQLRTFLAEASTQERIRAVVARRLRRKTPDALIDDIAQEANTAALESDTRPASMRTASGWIATVAARAVVDYFRREAKHFDFVDPEADPDELASEAEPPEDRWLVSAWAWLAAQLAHDSRDQETFELLVYKAQTRKGYEAVAAEHGMTAPTLHNRVHQFKNKYEPRWRKRQERMLLLAILFGGAMILVVAWAVLQLMHARPAPSPTPPAPTVTVPPPIQSAVQPPVEPPVENAAPPNATPAPNGPQGRPNGPQGQPGQPNQKPQHGTQ